MKKIKNLLFYLYTICLIVFVMIPLICVGIMSFSPHRFLTFPFKKSLSTKWFNEVFNSLAIQEAVTLSLFIALLVVLFSIFLATFGALAFARYSFKGQSIYQKIILLPIFFPQGVLGLGLLLWFNILGIPLSWKTAALAHMVWLIPIATLIISIRAFSYDPKLESAASDLGASKIQVFFTITLPMLAPGIFSGGLFAFLLSWVNFPISLYTSGVDTPAPLWIFSKMAVTFTPTAPALGFTVFLGSLIILLPTFIFLRPKS